MHKVEIKDFYATKKKKNAESPWSILDELMDSERVRDFFFFLMTLMQFDKLGYTVSLQ